MSNNKNPARVVAGLKSTLARDNVSGEAKMHAEERLKEMGALSTDNQAAPNKAKDTQSIEDPSDKSVSHAREILEAAGYTFTDEDANDDEHQVRVAAGYKAALNNPRVSDDAKAHAREYLKEHA
ncbi:hypothetical protein C8R46DRAFT_1341167 [Mycena filopes]|nr:hypothetical protein C8R46DRAFT_1341167 [Mycena filopes]